MLYSHLAGEETPHEKSVALILSKAAGKSLELISERIIYARLGSKCQNTTIIQVYAPNNAVKEDFYYQLQTALNKRKTRDLIMVTSMQRSAQTIRIAKHLWGLMVKE